MASKWEELAIDWTNPPSGVELYSGIFHIMSAINERYRVGLQNPAAEWYDVTQLREQLTQSPYAIQQIAQQIQNGITTCWFNYSSPARAVYDTADPSDDNYLYYDIWGLPDSYSNDDYNTLFGENISDTFGKYIFSTPQANVDEYQTIPNKQLLADSYNAITQTLKHLRGRATSANQYTKSVNELNVTDANNAYAALTSTLTVTAGTLIAPGIGYHASNIGGGSDRIVTHGVDTYSSGLNGDWRRAVPSSDCAGEYIFDIQDEDGVSITPPLTNHRPLTYFMEIADFLPVIGAFPRVYTPVPNPSQARADIGSLPVLPRPKQVWDTITPVINGGFWTYKVQMDAGEPDGLPTTAQFQSGQSRCMGQVNLSLFRPNLGLGGQTNIIVRGRLSVTFGVPNEKNILGRISLDVDGDPYLKYYTP